MSAAGWRVDLRDYLAAERTLLAWVRTGLALMGFGFVVVARFGIVVQSYRLSLLLSPSTTRQIDGSKMPDRRGVGFEARMSDRKGIAVGVVPSACACFVVTAFQVKEQARIWLNSPHPDLVQTRLIELLKKKKQDVVAELLEDALLGHPG